MRKTRHGEGLTVRLNGRRVNKTQLLEDQLKQAQKKLSELVHGNTVLRIKEASQLAQLDSYEVSLYHTALLLHGAADVNQSACEEPLLSAAMLDIQAFELMQQLQPASSRQVAQPLLSSQHTMGCTATPSQCADDGSSNSDEQQGSSACGEGSHTGKTSRSKRLLASITLKEVASMKDISIQELAERFKAALSRLALIQCVRSKGPAPLADTFDSAVDAIGKLFLLSVVAADEQLMQVLCMNMETMQPESLPEGHFWEAIVSRIGLQPQQRQHIHTAFQLYKQQRSTLMQQQRQIVEQLQELLGAQQAALPQQQQQQQGQQQGQQQQQQQQQQQREDSTTGLTVSPPPHAGAGRRDSDMWSVKSEQTQHLAAGQQQASASPGCACVSTASATTNSKSCGVEVVTPAAVLSLEAAEAADSLLQQLMRVMRMLKQQSRRLVVMWINLLSSEQHAEALLSAYPHHAKIPALCACVWEQEEVCRTQPQGKPGGMPQAAGRARRPGVQ